MTAELEIPNVITVWDQYEQPWKIEKGEPLYKEASKKFEENPLKNIIWPIEKILGNRGWGWWTVYSKLDDFIAALSQTVPDPSQTILIDHHRTYTLQELKQGLQKVGACLSSLIALRGTLEAQNHAVKQGLETGMQVSLASMVSTESLTSQRSKILASEPLFKNTKKIQIEQEAMLLVIKNWIDSYRIAWDTISRMMTAEMGEVDIASNRHA